jgi:hypothetical protein
MSKESKEPTTDDRFQIIFDRIEEMTGDPAGQEAEAVRQESEAIDELRRLTAEYAETRTISYTLT